MGPQFILLLSIGTLLYFFLAFLIYKQQKEIGYFFGFAALFIWTIAGGWIITFDRLSGMQGANWGLHYYYLFNKLFPVYLDYNYFTALCYYFFFLLLMQVVILVVYRYMSKEPAEQMRPLVVTHWKFQLFSVIAAILSFVTIYPIFMDALMHNKSLYTTIHATNNALFPIHQLLNQFSLLALIIGFLTLLSGENGIFLRRENRQIRFHSLPDPDPSSGIVPGDPGQ